MTRKALEAQLLSYSMAHLPGREAEFVGRAFGDLCRAVGVPAQPNAI